MNNTVKKLLLSKSKPIQLVLALLGAFMGLTIVMSGMQVLRITNAILQQKDLLGGDFIVVNKKVGLLNTISGSAPSFSGEEIADLNKISGIDDVGEFKSGKFRASMQLNGQMAEMVGPGIKTDMFFEAVPDKFVDADPAEWKWNVDSREIPIIIPGDYLKLYNAAFAQSQGLPVIPESLIKTIGFDIKLMGKGKEGVMRGKILGFSQRINSVLVPQSFLDWANKEYGSSDQKNPSRVILHSTDPTSPKLAAELRSKGYELNEEKLKSSDLNNVLQVLISAVSIVGILIVILALLGFMQYNQLMAYRSAYEIQTLHWLGFSINQLSKPYIVSSFISIFTTWAIASATLVGIQYFFTQWLKTRGFEIELPGILWSILTGFVISLFMAALSSIAAHSQVKNLAK